MRQNLTPFRRAFHTSTNLPQRVDLDQQQQSFSLEKKQNIRDRIREIENLKGVLSLFDTHGRKHNYLRISLTEKCNLRCKYCMPRDGIELTPSTSLLTTDEIIRVARIFVERGVNKIRLTGGEPSINRDLSKIIYELSSMKGVEDIGMTSNGIALHGKLASLKEAGLTKLNISLDTLDPEKFLLLTRHNGFKLVMKTLKEAEKLLPKVKINTVVMREINDRETVDLVEFTRDRNVDVRFIEYMPFGGNEFSVEKMVPYREILERIERRYGKRVLRLCDSPNDTTKAYKIDGYKGQFGFISSMTEHFCATCNRVRLTADGKIKACLHNADEISVRSALRSSENNSLVEHLIDKAIKRKKKQHDGIDQLLLAGNRPMILIGG